MTDTIRWQDIPHLDQKFELFQTPDGTVMGRKGSDLYETPITAVHFRTIIDAIDGKRDIGSIYQLLADRCPRDTLDLFFTECQAVFDTTATPSDLAEHAGDEPRAHPPKSVSSFSIAILGNLLGQSIHDRFAVAEWARCTPYSIDSFQSCLSEDFLASEASLTIRPASQRPETQSSPHRDRAYEQLEEATERQLLQICSRHNLVICALEGVPYRGILDVNQACLQSGVPCVFVVVHATSLFVGPMLIPSRTACFECGQLALFSEEDNILDPDLIEHFTAFSLDRQVFSARSIELASSMVYAEVESMLGIASSPRFNLLDSLTEVSCEGEETEQTTIFPFFRSKCSQCSTSRHELRPQSYTRQLVAEISSAFALTTAIVSAEPSSVPDGPRTIGIVGGGTAGYFTALALRAKLPHLQVTMVDSSKIPIIEVGEATTPPIIEFLHRYLGFGYQEFYEKVQPTWKLGIKFLWGLPGDYHFDFPFGDYSFLEEAFLSDNDINSLSLQSLMMSSNRGFVLEFDQDTHHKALFDVMAGAYAYHLDNKKLVAFLKEKAYEAGVEHIDAVISEGLSGFPKDILLKQ